MARRPDTFRAVMVPLDIEDYGAVCALAAAKHSTPTTVLRAIVEQFLSQPASAALDLAVEPRRHGRPRIDLSLS